MIPDTCSCRKGKLHEGTTNFTARVNGETIIIRDIPAYVCDSCDEAYFTIDVSRKIDEAVKDLHAGKLRARTLGAGKVELELNV